MALNPIVFTEQVVRSFLRYQLASFPFAVLVRLAPKLATGATSRSLGPLVIPSDKLSLRSNMFGIK